MEAAAMHPGLNRHYWTPLGLEVIRLQRGKKSEANAVRVKSLWEVKWITKL